MPRVFIIILHYGDVKDTQECLKSLKDLNYSNYEIVVVDNDPENRIKNLESGIKLTTNKENLGFAGGNNVGIKYALEKKADYILILNNDAAVDKNFLKELIKAGESNKRFGILGPIIYEHGTDKIHFAGGKINWLYTKGTHVQDTNYEIQDTDYITGCCLLIKREVINKIGLMPEDYFLYLEDVEWCLKARKNDFKCIVVPTAKIWHKVSKNTQEGSFSYVYYHTRNGLLLSRRNAPFFIKTLSFLNGFGIHKRQIIKLLIPSRLLDGQEKKEWARATIKGVKDFYAKKYGKFKNRN